MNARMRRGAVNAERLGTTRWGAVSPRALDENENEFGGWRVWGAGRVNVMVGPKSNLAGRTIEDVVITIPFTKAVQSTSLSVNHGTAHFDDATKCLRWEVGKVPKERSPCLSGGVTLAPGSETPESGPTLMVDFKIVMFSASGLKVAARLTPAARTTLHSRCGGGGGKSRPTVGRRDARHGVSVSGGQVRGGSAAWELRIRRRRALR